MKTIETEIEIEASTEKVWQVLIDFNNHPKWNPFIRSISGGIKEGEKLNVTLKPPGGKEMTFRPRVKKLEPGKELRWMGKLGVTGIFDGEHYFILEQKSAKSTRFIHGEIFKGLLVPFMGNILEKTKDGFIHMNKSLKAACEQKEKPVKAKRLVKKKPGGR